MYKIALCQFKIVDDKERNLNSAEAQMREAADKGADIVVLPEMFNCPYDNSKFESYSEEEGGMTYRFLSSLAQGLKIYVVGGSLPEKREGKLYNTSYAFDRDGALIGKFSKIHLFDVDIPDGIRFMESEVLSPGHELAVLETEFGKLGVAICYDMRFPELIRRYALLGVHGVIVPAAFNMTTGPAHWHLLARTRALDNQIYFAVCSPARDYDSSYVAYGHSIVTNPWGEIVGELDDRAGVLCADIDLDYVAEVREGLPLLKHRKEDIYR